jgi:2-polyprenyl-6-methoxyphenol hydroxylase-like FAD-dependent oxidoreductase
VKDWSKGRVTLLGDATHPIPQYLAQGACQATKDAVVLAEKAAENSITRADRPRNCATPCSRRTFDGIQWLYGV